MNRSMGYLDVIYKRVQTTRIDKLVRHFPSLLNQILSKDDGCAEFDDEVVGEDDSLVYISHVLQLPKQSIATQVNTTKNSI